MRQAPPDSGHVTLVRELESGGKDCDAPEVFIAQAKNECLMARLDTWKPVQMSRNPLYVILDIGCTRAMGSRPAVEALAQAAPSVGIWCEFLPTYTVFSFANSAQTVVKEKCRIWFPTSPACSTDIDICEEGTVPVLFSLPQMRMLSLGIEPTPEGVFLTCPSFGYNRTPARMATSQHVVLNLADFKACPTTSLNPSGYQGTSERPVTTFLTNPELERLALVSKPGSGVEQKASQDPVF